MTQKEKKENKEPWLGLKLIAAYRVKLPELEDLTDAVLQDYAKWQICKARNVLFKDPIWDDYTEEEILIEFFSILYDEDKDLLSEFLNKIKSVDEDTMDWFDEMEEQHRAKLESDRDSGEDEFEDNFT